MPLAGCRKRDGVTAKASLRGTYGHHRKSITARSRIRHRRFFGFLVRTSPLSAERIWDVHRNRGRVLRITLLAPEIVDAILDGRQPADLQVEDLLRPFPVGWREQRAEIWGPYP